MFKPIFEILIDPLGLPIEWYYEYIILAVIGIIAYRIAYSEVGGMYRSGLIDGKTSGSFFHWLIRLIIFAMLWAITYFVIWLGKIIKNNWKVVLLFTEISIGIAAILTLTIFIVKKYKNASNHN